MPLPQKGAAEPKSGSLTYGVSSEAEIVPHVKHLSWKFPAATLCSHFSSWLPLFGLCYVRAQLPECSPETRLYLLPGSQTVGNPLHQLSLRLLPPPKYFFKFTRSLGCCLLATGIVLGPGRSSRASRNQASLFKLLDPPHCPSLGLTGSCIPTSA